MIFCTVALLYLSVTTISQVKCDTGGETLIGRQIAADNGPTWLTVWDSRGRTYKYLSVNDDDDNDGDKLPQGRDPALVTLLLSLRLGSSRHVNGSGAANATAAEPTLALNDRIRGPDHLSDVTTTTITTTARPPFAETTTVADVNDTAAVTAPRKEIGSDDHVVKSTSDPPANGTAGAPDFKDELLRAAGPRRDDDGDDVRLKIVLTVRSPRRVSAAHDDDDDGNDSTRGKSVIVDAEDYNYLETDP